ncbi:mechanosensitive ion channel family protein [Sphingomonas sp. GCM10030256]|uniref:mechanosensitive ion channel family protein n=1 Tax=Sphingomonas sp. GCM10030256 TaxID=3273427 RepID=UPI00360E0E50
MIKLRRFLDWLVLNLDALLIGSIVAAVIVAAMLLLRHVGHRVVRSDPNCRSWRGVIGRVMAKTSLLFMVSAALAIVVSYAQPPQRIGRLFDVAFVVAFALQGAVWGRELILGAISQRIGDEPGGNALENAMGLIRVLVSVALFAVAIIVILDNLGVNVTALVAGLGIGGIAIGLAAQGIFSDLFAALAILFDRPFRRGDIIRFDQTTGTVEKIGLKTTRFRSLSGEQVIMANTKLLEREIRNLAQASARRITIHFAVETGIEQLDAIETAAAEAVGSPEGCKLVRCAVTGFGAGAAAYELVYDDGTIDNDRVARHRSDIIRALAVALQARELSLLRASEAPPPLAPF